MKAKQKMDDRKLQPRTIKKFRQQIQHSNKQQKTPKEKQAL